MGMESDSKKAGVPYQHQAESDPWNVSGPESRPGPRPSPEPAPVSGTLPKFPVSHTPCTQLAHPPEPRHPIARLFRRSLFCFD